MDRGNDRMPLIQRDEITILYERGGIKLYWKDREVTTGGGLNAAINTAGIWTDSSYGEWMILEKGDESIVIKNIWRQLPITCFWKLKMNKDGGILWDIDMEIEEALEMDERRAVIIVSPLYKRWVNSYEDGRFPQIIGWQDMPLEIFSSKLVGVRFSKYGLLPPLVLKFERNEFGKELPLIQNTSSEIGAHLVGVRLVDSQEKRYYSEGRYHYFSGKISLLRSEEEIDVVLEKERKLFLNIEGRKSKIYRKKKLKVLLVNMPWQRDGQWGVRAGSRWPHIKDESEGNYLPFPFFLAYSTSLLRKYDIEADLVDAIATAMPEDVFLEHLSQMNFDILVTETSVPSFFYDIELLKKLSSFDIPIVLCGPHPEIYNHNFLENNSFVDFVLFGEYELTLLELMKSIVQGNNTFSSIKGLIWRDRKSNVIKNPPREPFNIDILPWPYREGLPMEKYWDLPGDIPFPSVQMVASRGCPFSCNFCLWPQVLFGGRTYRTRRVDDVVDEMEYLVREKGFKSVYFDDDTFNIGKERIIKLCKEIIARGLNNIPWAVMAKADLMDVELLEAMRKAGLYAVKYGVESASQTLLDRCGKCLDLKKTEKMVEYTKSLGIKVHLTFSFGLPRETKDTVKKTIDYALKLEPHSVQFSIVTPFPGTTLFEELDKEGRILTKDWSLYDGHYSCVFSPENLSPQDLEEAKCFAYRKWADYQRKKRGVRGDMKRFFDYCHNYGISCAFKKSASYLKYMFFYRKKFIGKI